MIKVAINGFGRIGRLAFREIMKSKKRLVLLLFFLDKRRYQASPVDLIDR